MLELPKRYGHDSMGLAKHARVALQLVRAKVY
jgi:hypothetical protein